MEHLDPKFPFESHSQVRFVRSEEVWDREEAACLQSTLISERSMNQGRELIHQTVEGL
jgi:hypothetical protein